MFLLRIFSLCGLGRNTETNHEDSPTDKISFNNNNSSTYSERNMYTKYTCKSHLYACSSSPTKVADSQKSGKWQAKGSASTELAQQKLADGLFLLIFQGNVTLGIAKIKKVNKNSRSNKIENFDVKWINTTEVPSNELLNITDDHIFSDSYHKHGVMTGNLIRRYQELCKQSNIVVRTQPTSILTLPGRNQHNMEQSRSQPLSKGTDQQLSARDLRLYIPQPILCQGTRNIDLKSSYIQGGSKAFEVSNSIHISRGITSADNHGRSGGHSADHGWLHKNPAAPIPSNFKAVIGATKDYSENAARNYTQDRIFITNEMDKNSRSQSILCQLSPEFQAYLNCQNSARKILCFANKNWQIIESVAEIIDCKRDKYDPNESYINYKVLRKITYALPKGFEVTRKIIAYKCSERSLIGLSEITDPLLMRSIYEELKVSGPSKDDRETCENAHRSKWKPSIDELSRRQLSSTDKCHQKFERRDGQPTRHSVSNSMVWSDPIVEGLDGSSLLAPQDINECHILIVKGNRDEKKPAQVSFCLVEGREYEILELSLDDTLVCVVDNNFSEVLGLAKLKDMPIYLGISNCFEIPYEIICKVNIETHGIFGDHSTVPVGSNSKGQTLLWKVTDPNIARKTYDKLVREIDRRKIQGISQQFLPSTSRIISTSGQTNKEISSSSILEKVRENKNQDRNWDSVVENVKTTGNKSEDLRNSRTFSFASSTPDYKSIQSTGYVTKYSEYDNRSRDTRGLENELPEVEIKSRVKVHESSFRNATNDHNAASKSPVLREVVDTPDLLAKVRNKLNSRSNEEILQRKEEVLQARMSWNETTESDNNRNFQKDNEKSQISKTYIKKGDYDAEVVVPNESYTAKSTYPLDAQREETIITADENKRGIQGDFKRHKGKFANNESGEQQPIRETPSSSYTKSASQPFPTDSSIPYEQESGKGNTLSMKKLKDGKGLKDEINTIPSHRGDYKESQQEKLKGSANDEIETGREENSPRSLIQPKIPSSNGNISRKHVNEVDGGGTPEEHKRKRPKIHELLPNRKDKNAGLHNIGNTCYMNSVLQCLSIVPWERLEVEEPHVFVKDFLDLMNAMTKGGSSIEPYDFKQSIIYCNTRFSTSNQQDAHEFLTFVLFTLKQNMIGDAKIFLLDMFCGQLLNITEIQCPSEHQVKSGQDMHTVSLPVKMSEPVTVERSLASFVEKENLEEDDKARCKICRDKYRCSLRLAFGKLPKVLVLHLKKFDFYSREKLNVDIKFPLKNLIVAEDSGTERVYDLHAVCNHSGSLSSGHYTAFVKSQKTGDWFEYNDSRVQKISAAEVQNESRMAYLLFYKLSSSRVEKSHATLSTHL